MKYWKGFKYVVAEDFEIETPIIGYDILEEYTVRVHLKPNGRLFVSQGYPWDGNSGPCPDTKDSMDASASHDPLCDMINSGKLPLSQQPLVDQVYYDIAVKKGMWWRRARARLLAIRWYMTGKGSKRYTRKIYEA